MRYNWSGNEWNERWYLNVWSIHALAGGKPGALAKYLTEMGLLIRSHHQTLELHSNVNQKSSAIVDVLTIAEEPPPDDFWEAERWLESE